MWFITVFFCVHVHSDVLMEQSYGREFGSTSSSNPEPKVADYLRYQSERIHYPVVISRMLRVEVGGNASNERVIDN